MTARASRANLQELLEIALGALADISLSKDMSDPSLARAKAKRVYEEIRSLLTEATGTK